MGVSIGISDFGKKSNRDVIENAVHNLHGINLEDEQRIYAAFFEEVLPALEEQIGIKVKAVFHSGSDSYGLSNMWSDYDISFIAEAANDCYAEMHYWADLKTEQFSFTYDLYPYSKTLLLNGIAEYGAAKRRYPSVAYRTEKEQQAYRGHKGRETRLWLHNNQFEDKLAFVFSEFLLSDKILVRNDICLQPWFCNRFDLLSTVDILDMHYTRSYGNYNRYIQGEERVMVRKYLRTLHQIFTCNWILSQFSKPPKLFLELCKGQTLTDAVTDEVNKVLEDNKYYSGAKHENFCTPNKILNQYIHEQIGALGVKIARYPTDERFSRIIENTKEPNQQKVEFLC